MRLRVGQLTTNLAPIRRDLFPGENRNTGSEQDIMMSWEWHMDEAGERL